MITEDFAETLEELNPEALVLPGYDRAIVGVLERCGQPAIVVYSVEKCIDVICEMLPDDNADPESTYLDAVEYFNFNVVGAWVGDSGPGFLYEFADAETRTVAPPDGK